MTDRGQGHNQPHEEIVDVLAGRVLSNREHAQDPWIPYTVAAGTSLIVVSGPTINSRPGPRTLRRASAH